MMVFKQDVTEAINDVKEEVNKTLAERMGNIDARMQELSKNAESNEKRNEESLKKIVKRMEKMRTNEEIRKSRLEEGMKNIEGKINRQEKRNRKQEEDIQKICPKIFFKCSNK